jgi:hypothetical protein
MEPTRSRTVLVALVTSLVTSLVVGGGALAFASHQWSDVTTGNAFHDDIAGFTDAGCGAGYPDGTFRPTQPVLRQQAARFLRSCGTRITHEDDSESGTLVPGTGLSRLAVESMRAGALGDGHGYVLGLAVVDVSTIDTGSGDFPCVVSVTLTSPTAGFTDQNEASTVSFRSASSSVQSQTVTLTQLWQLPDHGEVIGQVNVAKAGCAATVRAEANLTLLYVPFDRDA